MEWVPAASNHWPVIQPHTHTHIYTHTHTTLAVFALSMSNKTIFTFVKWTSVLTKVPGGMYLSPNHWEQRPGSSHASRKFSFTRPPKIKIKMKDLLPAFGRGHDDPKDSQIVTQLLLTITWLMLDQRLQLQAVCYARQTWLPLTTLVYLPC